MDTSKVTRLEVITDEGRRFSSGGSDLEIVLSLQDDGRTLKVFVITKKDEQ